MLFYDSTLRFQYYRTNLYMSHAKRAHCWLPFVEHDRFKILRNENVYSLSKRRYIVCTYVWFVHPSVLTVWRVRMHRLLKHRPRYESVNLHCEILYSHSGVGSVNVATQTLCLLTASSFQLKILSLNRGFCATDCYNTGDLLWSILAILFTLRGTTRDQM